MAQKNKVSVSIKGKNNTSVTVGGNIGYPPTNNSRNEVEVSLEGENLNNTTVGGDIGETVLAELEQLLKVSLDNDIDKSKVAEISTQLSQQAKKPSKERNETRIKKLLGDLASYIGIVSLTTVFALKGSWTNIAKY